jgi:hypothetical protein
MDGVGMTNMLVYSLLVVMIGLWIRGIGRYLHLKKVAMAVLMDYAERTVAYPGVEDQPHKVKVFEELGDALGLSVGEAKDLWRRMLVAQTQNDIHWQ